MTQLAEPEQGHELYEEMPKQGAVYERHPLSQLWPDMPLGEFQDLVESISENGLLEPIVLYEGMVLDGWHRYQACKAAVVEPEYVSYAGDAPERYVVACNAHRRHLSPGDRADIVVTVMGWRKPGRAPQNGVESASPVEHAEGEEPPVATTQEMAEAAGVSPATIERAKARKREELDPNPPEPKPEPRKTGLTPLQLAEKQLAVVQVQFEESERQRKSLMAAMQGECQEELAKCWSEIEALKSQLAHYMEAASS